jgi:DNA repair exonuclease SbcCD ATPase subunit
MHVRKVELRHFIRHDLATFAFPERGVLTVTGPNESGKSSIVEAVAFGLWGKTICGSPDPWSADEGAVQVTTDRAIARRTRKGGKVSLLWRLADEAGWRSYATATKAQEALDSVVGEFGLWRKTSVFSSADTAQFSGATDGERKRLLEALLGLDEFETAIAFCRADLKRVTDATAQQETKKQILRERIVSQEKILAEAMALRDAGPPETPADSAALLARAEELQKMILAGTALAGELTERTRRGADARAQAFLAVRTLEEKAELLQEGRCPTCAQEIPPALIADLRGEIAKAQEAAIAVERVEKQEEEAAKEEFAEIAAEQQALVQQRTDAISRARTAEKMARQVAAVQKVIAETTEALDRLRADEQALGATESSDLAERDVLTAVEQVLGLRGVRAHLLSRTLSGIERAANVYLRAIARDDMKIALSPYTEKKTGGIADAIAILVQDGEPVVSRPYRAFSGGARRRIDVALLLALSEVSAAAHGTPPGALVFDEPFDALDADGARAVSRVVADLSQDRAVMVVTHNPSLAAELPGERIALTRG